MTPQQPYLVFLGDATDVHDARTAFSLREWVPECCIGEFALPEATLTIGLPFLTPAAARRRGARSLVIGVAPASGIIAPNWVPALLEALEAGLDLVSEARLPLEQSAVLQLAAREWGRRLINVSHSELVRGCWA